MGITRSAQDTKKSEQNVLNNSYDTDFDVLAFENLEWDPAGSLPRKVVDTLALQVAVNSGDSNITYVGEATAGSATSGSVWRIKKINETTGTVVTWADGNTNFDNVWNNRESLSYS